MEPQSGNPAPLPGRQWPVERMLITLFLWHAGVISAPHFYISGYMEEHKDEYEGFIAARRLGNMVPVFPNGIRSTGDKEPEYC